MTKKSILLSLGAITAVVTPIAAVVACSTDTTESTVKNSVAMTVERKAQVGQQQEDVQKLVSVSPEDAPSFTGSATLEPVVSYTLGDTLTGFDHATVSIPKVKVPTLTGYAVPTPGPTATPTKFKSPAMTGYAVPTLAPILAPTKFKSPAMTGYAVPKPMTFVATFAPREVITGFSHSTSTK